MPEVCAASLKRNLRNTNANANANIYTGTNTIFYTNTNEYFFVRESREDRRSKCVQLPKT